MEYRRKKEEININLEQDTESVKEGDKVNEKEDRMK
jgi:hypothetical protein